MEIFKQKITNAQHEPCKKPNKKNSVSGNSLQLQSTLAKDFAGTENISRQYYCSAILLIHFLCLCFVILG